MTENRNRSYPQSPWGRLLAAATGIAVIAALTGAGPATPPAPRVLGPHSTEAGPATYSFRSSGAKGFRCSLDGPRLHACPATYRVTLTAGAHVLRVRAVGRGRRLSATTVVRIAASQPVPVGGEVVARIHVPDAPLGLAFAAGKLWVTEHRSQGVARIDPATNSIDATLRVTSGPDDQPGRLSLGDGGLWGVNYSGIPGTLVHIDPAAGRVISVAKATGELCCDVAVGGGSVWVAAPDVGDGAVLRIDETTNAVTATIPIAHPYVGAYGADALWVSSGPDVLRVDPSTNRVAARIPVGNDALVQAFDAGTVWVSTPSGVVRIDPTTNAVKARITLPGGGGSVAVDSTSAWVSGEAAGKVVLWRIGTTANVVTGVVPLGPKSGEGIADVATGAGAVWAALFDNDTVVRVAPS